MIGWMRVWIGGAVLCAVALTPAAAGLAQAPDTVLLEELTWTEVRDAVRAGKTTIIVPAGGTEQNGPHMALGKHNARVKILSERIARALGDALVAPVIAYVPEGGRAQLQATRLPPHRPAGRPRIDPGRPEGGGGAAQPRVGRDAGAGARDRGV